MTRGGHFPRRNTGTCFFDLGARRARQRTRFRSLYGSALESNLARRDHRLAGLRAAARRSTRRCSNPLSVLTCQERTGCRDRVSWGCRSNWNSARLHGGARGRSPGGCCCLGAAELSPGRNRDDRSREMGRAVHPRQAIDRAPLRDTGDRKAEDERIAGTADESAPTRCSFRAGSAQSFH